MQASWEAEELRSATLSLEDQLQEVQASAEGTQAQLGRTEHDLQSARTSIARLEVQARECEALPRLRADLRDARARGNELQIARDQLQVSLSCRLLDAGS